MRISVGEVNGDDWENLMHKVLKLIHQGNYQKVPSKFGGDLGIEGFTIHGHAYQCYCANGNPPSKELYKNQRDKITRDINKLVRNEDKLVNILGSTVIDTWKFVTPRYEDKALLKHCRKKENEVTSKNCQHIENGSFSIQIMDEDNYVVQIEKLIGINSLTYDPHIPTVEKEEIQDWKEEKNKFYSNLKKKLSKVIKDNEKQSEFIHSNIEALIMGEALLHDLNSKFPDFSEEIIRLINSWELDVQQKSQLWNKPAGDLITETSDEFRNEIIDEFQGQLSTATARHIARRTISYWLCKCPLDF